jgi:hypothetical protein
MKASTGTAATVSAPPCSPRPLEHLESEIVELASQITAANARLTALIAEFDKAEGWRSWGMRSTAHWLSWQCGMALGASREHVRVARALLTLPVISREYAAARLSYSKVRALTRFATPETEAELAESARFMTGSQIEKLARAAGRAKSPEQAQGQYAAAYLRFRVTDDGSVVGSFRLPPAEGAVFTQAVQAGAGRLPDYASEGPADEPETKTPSPRGYAWVLATMAGQFLDGLLDDATTTQADRFQLVLHTSAADLAQTDQSGPDERAGGEFADGTSLHASTVRRISCDCPVTAMVDDPDGVAIHVGRKSRRIRARLRRAVEARDRGRCRAPGCSQSATQIHHIRHWANGGPTCLGNLISLCDAHHWLVHEGGFTIVARNGAQWALLGPDGVTVEPTPPAPVDAPPPPHDDTVVAVAVTGAWDGSPLTSYAIDVILTNIGGYETGSRRLRDVSAETLRVDLSPPYDDDEWTFVWPDETEDPVENIEDVLAEWTRVE